MSAGLTLGTTGLIGSVLCVKAFEIRTRKPDTYDDPPVRRETYSKYKEKCIGYNKSYQGEKYNLSASVSYTHLDVYKRQVVCCSIGFLKVTCL